MIRIRPFALLLAPWVATFGVAACTIDFDQWSATCGDGVVDPGEECDQGPQGDSTCTAQCAFIPVEPGCGDGVVVEPEECDDGNSIDGDGCSANCTFGSFFVANNVGDPAYAYLNRPGVGLIGTGANERFLVAWPDKRSGEYNVIMTQELDLEGVPLGQPKQVSTNTGNTACSSIATNSEGRAVLVWAALQTGGAADQWETAYAVIEPDGSTGLPQVVAGVPMLTFLGCPQVAATSGGDFCMIMQQKPDEVTPPSAHIHCLDSAGADKGHPPNLSETHAGGSGRQWGQHAIVGYKDGFVALYFDASQVQDAGGNMVYPIIAAELDADGLTTGDLYTVSTAAGDYIGSAFAQSGTDIFTLSYGAVEQSIERYMLERFEVFGPTSVFEQAASGTPQNEFGGRLFGDDSGAFAAVWSGFESGKPCELYLRKFTAEGAPDADHPLEQLEDSPTTQCGEGAEGVVASNGHALVVWNLKVEGSDTLDIQAKMLAHLF